VAPPPAVEVPDVVLAAALVRPALVADVVAPGDELLVALELAGVVAEPVVTPVGLAPPQPATSSAPASTPSSGCGRRVTGHLVAVRTAGVKSRPAGERARAARRRRAGGSACVAPKTAARFATSARSTPGNAAGRAQGSPGSARSWIAAELLRPRTLCLAWAGVTLPATRTGHRPKPVRCRAERARRPGRVGDPPDEERSASRTWRSRATRVRIPADQVRHRPQR